MSSEIRPSESKAGAGVAGAGGGTLVAVLASTLPDDHGLKPYLLIAAPSVAIFLSGMWLWANIKTSNWLRDREVRSVLAAARATIQEALDSPHITETHRTNLRQELEKLELMAVGHHMKRIESIKIFKEGDMPESGT